MGTSRGCISLHILLEHKFTSSIDTMERQTLSNTQAPSLASNDDLHSFQAAKLMKD